MKNIIIGTAGHIDHGKTTLIKALTGYNTDRWAEEQRRGITIDLGFTHFNLPNGDRAGIVDVPGHEKFIPHMVAGVVGMDLVLVVVAADEGIMPQTREHLDILKLLGIDKCILVLNKCDLVDEEWLEMAEEEIREELSDTFLKNVLIVKVSAASGEGLSNLVEEIQRMTEEEVEEKDTAAIPRLPIDRVFTIPGFGTVVTGTLVSGVINKESNLELYPLEKGGKIRNIQVYGTDEEECCAGQRVAINLSNVKKQEVRRGCVLAPVNSMKNTNLLDVKLEMLKSSPRILTNRARLHLFTGTSEVLCRAVLLEHEELKPGESGYVQLRLEEKIALRRGDKFVVRFYSPMETIGGGIILEPNPGIKKRFRKDVIEELQQKEKGSIADVLELHIRSRKDALFTVAELAKRTAFTMEETEKNVQELERGGQVQSFPLKKDIYVWHRIYVDRALEELQKVLAAYEKEYPYRHGMKKAEIQTTYFKKIKPNVFALVLKMWEDKGVLKCVGEYVSTLEFEAVRDGKFDKVSRQLLDIFGKAGYEFVKYSELVLEGVSGEVKDDILNILCEDGSVVKVCDDCYSLPDYMDSAKKRIAEMLSANPVISISQVRDAFKTSRKCAKQILEYTDSMKITRKTSAESEWTIRTEIFIDDIKII